MAKLTLAFKNRPLGVYPLHGRGAEIGRDPSCKIVIDSLAVIPRHAEVGYKDKVYTIRSAAAAPDLIVNGHSKREHQLADGDVVLIGKHTITFTADDPTEPDLDTQAQPPTTGFLQITNGSNVGRVIRLDKPMTQVGNSGAELAMVTHRDNGYHVAHLHGAKPVTVNGKPIGEHAHHLLPGDSIEVGDLHVRFYLEAVGAIRPALQSQRRFSRVAFDAPGTISEGESSWETTLIDVSLKGALVEQPPGWHGRAGDELRLEARLEDGGIMRMGTRVAHIEEQRIGLYCEEIDIDSVTHLRRIVELNMADPALLERELAALG